MATLHPALGRLIGTVSAELAMALLEKLAEQDGLRQVGKLTAQDLLGAQRLTEIAGHIADAKARAILGDDS